MDYLHYISGPAIGALIGYCTNYIAVKMLFHPYKEVKLFGLTLPFTPGVIPKNKPRLARAISRAVADVLLTKEDIAGLITDAAIDSAGTALVANSGLFGEATPDQLAQRFGSDGLHTEQLHHSNRIDDFRRVVSLVAVQTPLHTQNIFAFQGAEYKLSDMTGRG